MGIFLKYKIWIDGYYFGSRIRGMAKYTQALTNELDGNAKFICTKGFSAIKESFSRILVRKFPFPIWEQIILPVLSFFYKIEYLLCPYNTAPVFLFSKTKIILVVHDLIFLDVSLNRNASVYHKIGAMYRRIILPLVIHKAYKVITVSLYSKNEIVKRFKIDESRVFVIPNSINISNLSDVKNEVESCDNYIFTIAGDSPSKNLDRLINAFSIIYLNNPSIKLVVAGVAVGSHFKYKNLINELGLADAVVFLDYISDVEMISWYKNASLYVCASLQEGFGIPVLEAMAAGIPVVSSNTTSLPEVAGGAAWYFNPYEINDIVLNINLALNATFAEKMNKKEAGFYQVEQYSVSKIQKIIDKLWFDLGVN